MRTAFLATAALMASFALQAQNHYESPADTVYLRAGGDAPLHIKSIEKSDQSSSGYRIRTLEPLETMPQEKWRNTRPGFVWRAEQHQEGLWSTELDKIVFSDGYLLQFSGGELNREQLLNAPFFREAHGKIRAEGVLELTQDETRRLLGDETYYLRYRAYRRQTVVGLARTLVGTPFAVGAIAAEKGSGIKETYTEYDGTGHGGYSGVMKHELSPALYTILPVGTVTALYGLGEMLVYNRKIGLLAEKPGVSRVPSRNKVLIRTLAGGGMMLAGGGIIWAGWNHLSKHKTWYEYYKNETGYNHVADREGSKPSVPWLLPAAGALLFNFGLTEFSLGLNGLGGYRSLQKAGLENARIHAGMTLDRIGLTLVF